ncbi:MAG TPA: PQQ-dependent sugar dehydrogenase [Polyangia bacterium]|nr:PQQ-dependent sugar dehydrogenase [Polyangia bacterium]
MLCASVAAAGTCAWICALDAHGETGARPAATPFFDYRLERPGASHKITVRDLPPPREAESVDNGPKLVPRPAGAWPGAPAGFRVDFYAGGLPNPRLIRTAPNGDFVVAESSTGEVSIFRGVGPDGRALVSQRHFARGLNKPFGLAFYPAGSEPRWLYVGNTDGVVRIPYRNGDLLARGPAQRLADLPGGGLLRGGGHWSRDLAFSPDGKTLYVSVGSRSNVDDTDGNAAEYRRADILAFDLDGDGVPRDAGNPRVHASGIRNAVGIAVHPASGELWASVNERDKLGDDLVPDYITHVEPGGFYGWPWFYIGGHQDPRHPGKHPELASKVIVPDVLLQPHDASLEMTFYDGAQFPPEYRGDIFAAEHGSWNRKARCGYEVVRVPMHGGPRSSGEYEDFLTGFVTASGEVWGRPVGVAVAKDGALMVTDDATNVIWRVSWVGKAK